MALNDNPKALKPGVLQPEAPEGKDQPVTRKESQISAKELGSATESGGRWGRKVALQNHGRKGG